MEGQARRHPCCGQVQTDGHAGTWGHHKTTISSTVLVTPGPTCLPSCAESTPWPPKNPPTHPARPCLDSGDNSAIRQPLRGKTREEDRVARNKSDEICSGCATLLNHKQQQKCTQTNTIHQRRARWTEIPPFSNLSSQILKGRVHQILSLWNCLWSFSEIAFLQTSEVERPCFEMFNVDTYLLRQYICRCYEIANDSGKSIFEHLFFVTSLLWSTVNTTAS